MRNPNGFGSVTKLSGNRRRPFMVKKTIGYNANGYPISEIIGYYETREAANIALAEYNAHPYDVSLQKTTLRDLWEMWLEKEAPLRATPSVIKARKWVYNTYIGQLANRPYAQIRLPEMQYLVDSCGKGEGTQKSIKKFFATMDNYALALELNITPKHSQIKLGRDDSEKRGALIFTEPEIVTLWDNLDAPLVDATLIYLYTGWRISELLQIPKSAVDLDQMIMTGGMKTAAGKNRIVPIHERIQPLVIARMDAPGNRLVCAPNGKAWVADEYRVRWHDALDDIGLGGHRPHDTRHTFRSRLDTAGGNKVAIDMLMGHSSGSIGERVYTHKTIDELRNTIALLA